MAEKIRRQRWHWKFAFGMDLGHYEYGQNDGYEEAGESAHEYSDGAPHGCSESKRLAGAVNCYLVKCFRFEAAGNEVGENEDAVFISAGGDVSRLVSGKQRAGIGVLGRLVEMANENR